MTMVYHRQFPGAGFWAYPWAVEYIWEDTELEGLESIWDNESHSPRAKVLTATPANSLKRNARTKVSRKKSQESLVAFWHSGISRLYSPVYSVGKSVFLLFFSLPSSLYLQTHNQLTHQSRILLPMKCRTYFPFIIKLYGLIVKTTCFKVNMHLSLIWGKLLELYESPFPHLWNGIMMVPALQGCCEGYVIKCTKMLRTGSGIY